MKKLPALLFLSIFFVCSVFAQSPDGWVRVQTDDGEFSIEVPEEHKYFFSKDGFVVSWETGEYLTENMSMLTAYKNKTILSIEAYDAIPAVLDRMRELDMQRSGTARALNEGPDETIGKTKVKTLLRMGDDAYVSAKYFRVGKKIVVLFAAAKTGSTPEMERFFSSARAKQGKVPADPGTPFSKLVKWDVTMSQKDTEEKKDAAPVAPPKKTDDPSVTKMVVLRTFPASYVPKARAQGISGNIRLRVHFGLDGFVDHIEVNEKLSGGLLRQTLYSAIRMRYFPEEKDGKPVRTSRPVVYSFKIY